MTLYPEIVFLHPRNKLKQTEKHSFLLIKEDIQEADQVERDEQVVPTQTNR